MLTKLTLDVLNYDCLISVFMFLDVETLANVVAAHKELYLDAAKTVFKRKFQNEITILDSSSTLLTTNYILRLQYFGEEIKKLIIKVPLPQMHQIFDAIHANCQQSLIEFGLHLAQSYENNSSMGYDLNAIRNFTHQLDIFIHLHSLQCKYGDLHSKTGRFDHLDISIPSIPSLKKLTIDGFGGRLENNTKMFIQSNPQIEEFTLIAGYDNLHANYITYIAEKLIRLKTLVLCFAVLLPTDSFLHRVNFESLEKVKVTYFFNLATNFLPFLGYTMNKLDSLDYLCTTTNNELILIVSQFEHLKKLKIGSDGLVDEYLVTLAENLKEIKIFEIADVLHTLYNQPIMASYTAEGIKAFLEICKDLQYLYISLQKMNYKMNKELISNVKQLLRCTKWTVMELPTEERIIIVIAAS